MTATASGAAAQVRRGGVLVVLIDAQCGLGRPLCTDAQLCEAISIEVIAEAQRAEARNPLRLLTGGGGSAAKRKEEMKMKIAAVTKAVLAGERAPPGGLQRIVDALSGELCGLSARGLCGRVICQLFVSARAGEEETSSAFPKTLMPVLFSGKQPDELPQLWEESQKGGELLTFSEVCASGFRGATSILVVSNRMLSLDVIGEQLPTGPEASPALHWFRMGSGAALTLLEMNELSDYCLQRGNGTMQAPGSLQEVKDALYRLCGEEPGATPEASAQPATEQQAQPVEATPVAPATPATSASPTDCDADKAVPAKGGGAVETIAVTWSQPGSLGLSFASDAWVITQSGRQEVQVGDRLVAAADVDATGGDEATSQRVTAVLQSGVRPLVLKFARTATATPATATTAASVASPGGGGGWLGGLAGLLSGKDPQGGAGIGAKLRKGVVASADVVETRSQQGPPSLGAGGYAAAASGSKPSSQRQAATGEVVAGVLQKHAADLARLSPADRKARIRDLVAQEMGALDPAGGCKSATSEINRLLNAERTEDQRLLLEWILVLGRVSAYCGDLQSLGRSICCCTRWQKSLSPAASSLSLYSWKWCLRFGEPISHRKRWTLWKRLLFDGRKLRRPGQPPPASNLARWRAIANDDHYNLRLESGRNDATLTDAREVISADVPRTLSGLRSSHQDVEDRRARLLPACAASCDCDASLDDAAIAARQDAVQRILLALAAECPSVGYCQGLDRVVAFMLTVAEDATSERPAAAEADFRALEPELEPPLKGLRDATAVLATLLQERQPELARHLASEGTGAELLALPWLQTFFVAFLALPRESLCHLWDCWLLDGSPKVLIRAALFVFQRAQEAMLGAAASLEEVVSLLKYSPPSTTLREALQVGRFVPEAWLHCKVTRKRLRLALEVAAVQRTADKVQAPAEPPPSEPMQLEDDDELVEATEHHPASSEAILDEELA
eukprot:TRINITY_DN20678_c0_g1_i2.p1 TRINITY_DN20678_c0_g1~~TRINITY_DN20678_c0_g1_i2.p1  ORF type:complete len:966 (+),score=234.75 TRINITY_DN20678_c0_g1_i2:73-2970(+)